MSERQSGFLCGLIKEFKPKRILEIGVAAGGTTAIMLNCISMLGLETSIVSIDGRLIIIEIQIKKLAIWRRNVRPYWIGN